ncbi:MAG TPA: hypothetical protein ENN29_06015 [Candidatus Hydrogenedentes bacterium]|nr:hypothetical protein [Candidatus Hydrogenedentota bacterium]
MKWLRRNKPESAAGKGDGAQETFPLVKKRAMCHVCGDVQSFTQVWRRAAMVRRCPNCGLVFENPEELYKRFQPACPKCEEPLEQPGFEYGYCDRCGSKFELMEGAKPGLLPNQSQRDEMRKHGKSWSYV